MLRRSLSVVISTMAHIKVEQHQLNQYAIDIEPGVCRTQSYKFYESLNISGLGSKALKRTL